MLQIELLTNQKIAEDAPVHIFIAEFEDAKSRYGYAMCDSFMPKAGPVTIAYLSDWNINMVEEGPAALLSSTKAVGHIEVFSMESSGAAGEQGSKFSKGKLDLRFRIRASSDSFLRSSVSVTLPDPDPAAIAELNPKIVKKKSGAAQSATAGAAESAPKAVAARTPTAAGASIKCAVSASPAAAIAAATDPADCTPSATDASVEHHHGGEGQTITPWEVEAEEGGIDYEKLIRVRVYVCVSVCI